MPIPVNISASTGAAILGASRYDTAINQWLRIMESRQPGFCEKNGYELPVFEESAATRFGSAFESAIIGLAEAKQGHKIGFREAEYKIAIDDDRNAITCHIDGKYDDPGYTLHEAKTTNYFAWLNNFIRGVDGEPDRVPVEYLIQANHQMLCTGADKVILSVLVFPKRQQEWEDEGIVIDDHESIGDMIISIYRDGIFKARVNPLVWAHTLNDMGFFHQYDIIANQKLQELMLEKYEQFWRENIIGGNVPDFQDFSDVRAIVRDPVGTIVLEGDSALLAKEAQQIAREEKILKARKDHLKTAICQVAYDSENTIDDDSKDKWIFRDEYGAKLASRTAQRFTWAKAKD